MATYVLMTKLSPDSMKDPRGRRAAGQQWMKKVQELCPTVKWVAHYALLGPYDFMSIYDAEDDKSAFEISLLSRELGAAAAESWPAMSYDDFLPLIDVVEKA